MIKRIIKWFSGDNEPVKLPYACSISAVNNRFEAAVELWKSGKKDEAFDQFQMIQNALKDIEAGK